MFKGWSDAELQDHIGFAPLAAAVFLLSFLGRRGAVPGIALIFSGVSLVVGRGSLIRMIRVRRWREVAILATPVVCGIGLVVAINSWTTNFIAVLFVWGILLFATMPLTALANKIIRGRTAGSS